ncbi:hypothetical protein B0I37DRAFT_408394 [Chaetomium sp. MPI-CAGE-AT-0009]|nr:hypothetical protein B0I37DRAFT_408394 [Chaetomium sp. MPI-CAGE-AT-0009]
MSVSNKVFCYPILSIPSRPTSGAIQKRRETTTGLRTMNLTFPATLSLYLPTQKHTLISAEGCSQTQSTARVARSGCLQINDSRFIGVRPEGHTGQGQSRVTWAWCQVLDPDSYHLTDDKASFGIFWCRQSGCQNYYRYQRPAFFPWYRFLLWGDSFAEQ